MESSTFLNGNSGMLETEKYSNEGESATTASSDASGSIVPRIASVFSMKRKDFNQVTNYQKDFLADPKEENMDQLIGESINVPVVLVKEETRIEERPDFGNFEMQDRDQDQVPR